MIYRYLGSAALFVSTAVLTLSSLWSSGAAAQTKALAYAHYEKGQWQGSPSLTLKFGVTEFFHPTSKVRVTFVPMIHVASPDFYQKAEQILESQDIVLYESIRPAGFFGPPFEDDPVLKTEKDFVDRTIRRLYSIGQQVTVFEKKHKRKAVTWEEVFGPGAQYLSEALLYDTWGQPLRLTSGPEGLDISSAGPPGTNRPIHLSQLTRRSPYLLSFLRYRIKDQYIEMAKTGDLMAQVPFSVYARPSSRNIDVPDDMMFAIPIWKIWQLPRRFRDRMQFPADRLTELLATLNPDEPKSIGIVYGMMHGSDFEKVLVRHGFQAESQNWVTAISGEGAPNLDALKIRNKLVAMAALQDNKRRIKCEIDLASLSLEN